jgi:hypothetical protein
MKQAFIKKAFLIPALLLIIILAISCSKHPYKNSPAFIIRESEKLVIPASIDLPDKSVRVVTYYAEGVQKYRAQVKAGSNPVTYEWAFVAPQATLYNSYNEKVGTHSAGPTWQLYGSGDSVYAQAFSPPRAVASPDPNSIDWLLLMTRTGTVPTGVFANVAYIQRIATKGGKAPSTLPASAGETIDVKYTAVYRFSK